MSRQTNDFGKAINVMLYRLCIQGKDVARYSCIGYKNKSQIYDYVQLFSDRRKEHSTFHRFT